MSRRYAFAPSTVKKVSFFPIRSASWAAYSERTVPLLIVREVRLVVVQQVQLDGIIDGAIQEKLIDGVGVRADTCYVFYRACIARPLSLSRAGHARGLLFRDYDLPRRASSGRRQRQSLPHKRSSSAQLLPGAPRFFDHLRKHSLAQPSLKRSLAVLQQLRYCLFSLGYS